MSFSAILQCRSGPPDRSVEVVRVQPDRQAPRGLGRDRAASSSRVVRADVVGGPGQQELPGLLVLRGRGAEDQQAVGGVGAAGRAEQRALLAEAGRDPGEVGLSPSRRATVRAGGRPASSRSSSRRPASSSGASCTQRLHHAVARVGDHGHPAAVGGGPHEGGDGEPAPQRLLLHREAAAGQGQVPVEQQGRGVAAGGGGLGAGGGDDDAGRAVDGAAR